jgi:F1F0 ATPase subunit 2
MSGAGLSFAVRIAGWLGLGGAAGTAFFVLLAVTTRLYARGRAWPWGVLVHLLRWLAVSALLATIARHGALPLLATAAGFFAARAFVVRRTTRVPW